MNGAIPATFSSNELPRVTLITPSYNAAAYLGTAIESVLGQDYPNIEYLVMDGGSTDGTLKMLEGFAGKLNWISAQDGGQADAIAQGFERTSGEIIGWLNADDVLKPGAVRTIVEAFLAHPEAGLIYGNADFIDRNGRTIAPCTVVESYSRHRLLFYGDYIIQPAAFFTREAYSAAGGLDRSLHWAMDWDLWLRLSRQCEVIYIERNLASYRWLGSNKTAGGGFDRLNEVEAVARRYGCHGLPAYFRLEKARLLAGEAGRNLRSGQVGQMLNSLARTAATILTSWDATRSLVNPHVWRNYLTAKVLYRQVTEFHPECL